MKPSTDKKTVETKRETNKESTNGAVGKETKIKRQGHDILNNYSTKIVFAHGIFPSKQPQIHENIRETSDSLIWLVGWFYGAQLIK